MQDNEDYYGILGVDHNASFEQIKEAYIFKVNIYHPDRLRIIPERIRNRAEDELKKVNQAYEVLSNPKSRSQYDSSRFRQTIAESELPKTRPTRRPKPEVYPKTIEFNDALPYVKQKGSFFVRNVGGQFRKVLISKTPEWINVVETRRLSDSNKLPIEVKIEAMGIHWGKTISTRIVIRLDEAEETVDIKLRIARKPR